MKNEKKKLVTCVKKVALILKLILKAQKRMKNVLLLFKKNLTNNNMFFFHYEALVSISNRSSRCNQNLCRKRKLAYLLSDWLFAIRR